MIQQGWGLQAGIAKTSAGLNMCRVPRAVSKRNAGGGKGRGVDDCVNERSTGCAYDPVSGDAKTCLLAVRQIFNFGTPLSHITGATFGVHRDITKTRTLIFKRPVEYQES